MRLGHLLAAILCVGACGDGADGGTSENGGHGGQGGGTGGNGAAIGVGGNGATASGGSHASSEICDGIDNDGNGIIDDVDVGNDGVCDCLRIATLGEKGQWGAGNVFASWLDARSDNGAVGLGSQVLTPELIKSFHVIVVQNVSEIGRTYSAGEVQALNDWVHAGGGVMTLIGYGDPPERTNANTLLAPFNISYGSTQILQKSGGNTVPVTTWSPHPVTQGVSQVGVDNGYPVAGGGSVLASEQGHDMLRAFESGQGHVLVWGDEWITYDSEWTGHPDYQVELFWLNAIKWLTSSKECQVPIPPIT